MFPVFTGPSSGFSSLVKEGKFANRLSTDSRGGSRRGSLGGGHSDVGSISSIC